MTVWAVTTAFDIDDQQTVRRDREGAHSDSDGRDR